MKACLARPGPAYMMKEMKGMSNRRKRLVSVLALLTMTAGLFAGVAGCKKDESGNTGGAKDTIVIATMSETPSLTNNCTLESMDLATYLSDTTEGNYSACIGGYNTTDQLIYCKGLFHSESIGGSNRARLADPKVDELIEEAMVTLDADERQKIVEERNAYLNELCVHIPLWQPIALRAYNAKLKGVEINAVGNLYFQNCYWEE